MANERNVEEKRKLVRCWMVNPAGEGRWRFVELEAFRLWEYVMSHKHGMTIDNLSMCLWVPDSLFQQNSAMFKEAGTVTPVNQVTIERYDPNYGFYHLIQRYCLAEDTDEMIRRLRGHIAQQTGSETGWGLHTTEGWGIEPNVGELVEPVALGLA
jgi:hypothetical protein